MLVPIVGSVLKQNSIDIDHDPSKIARAERKARVVKNEQQMAQNIARTQGESTAAGPSSKEQRKGEINRTLATSRVSTASMGKFDKVLEGEKKLKGVKRKVSSSAFVVYGRQTCICSLNPPRRPSRRRRRRIFPSYRKWKGNHTRKKPRKAQEMMFSTYAKPFASLVEEREALPLPNPLVEAKGRADEGDFFALGHTQHTRGHTFHYFVVVLDRHKREKGMSIAGHIR